MMETRLHAQPKAAPPPSFTPVRGGVLQRKCACGGSACIAGDCEGCSKNRLSLQRSTRDSELETQNFGGVPPIVHEVLSTSGQPLDAETRAFMEPRFGHDFSRVRVHADSKAAQSAHATNALAYTVGQHVVFGAGRYSPRSESGQQLLAHELTHVVQQRSLDNAGAIESVDPLTQAESEAVSMSQGMGTSAWQPNLGGGSDCHLNHISFQRAPDDATGSAGENEAPVEVENQTSILWFELNSDKLRQDADVDSLTHFAVAIERIHQHLDIAGDEGQIIVHGYASVEGDEARNVALSTLRANRVKSLLIDAGTPTERITTIGHGPDSSLPGLSWNRRVEIELAPTIIKIQMDPIVVTAVNCICPPSTRTAYDAETFRFIGSIGPLVNSIAAKSGVPPHAVAGGIADEYNTQRGLRGVIDGLQNAVVGSLFEWQIDIDRFFDFHYKLLNTLENDVGPANVKVRTALELVQAGDLEVPGSPPSDIQVKRIVDYLLTEEGTVAASAAVIGKAQSLFGPYLGDYDEGFEEAVLVEYFKQGDGFYDRFSSALAKNPNHQPCPGDDGCQFLYNHDQIEAALKASSP